MSNLENYCTQYLAENVTMGTATSLGTSSSGYWEDNTWHWQYYPYSYPTYYYPNKTETAFKLIKKFVEMKLIKEPKTFKEFCDLIDKVAGVI